jgi:hypothetical protein
VILECSHFGRQQVTADRIEAGILLCLIVDLLERKPQSNKSSTTIYIKYVISMYVFTIPSDI